MIFFCIKINLANIINKELFSTEPDESRPLEAISTNLYEVWERLIVGVHIFHPSIQGMINNGINFGPERVPFQATKSVKLNWSHWDSWRAKWFMRTRHYPSDEPTMGRILQINEGEIPARKLECHVRSINISIMSGGSHNISVVRTGCQVGASGGMLRPRFP